MPAMPRINGYWPGTYFLYNLITKITMDLKIMLADDDPDDVTIFDNLVREIFKESPRPYDLSIVSNGSILMKELASATILPDILFLDINMPLKDGLRCLAEIKNDKKYKDITVIMLSTSSWHAHVRTAYENGAHLYIVKSADLEKLKRDIIMGLHLRSPIYQK